jgi:putative transposase
MKAHGMLLRRHAGGADPRRHDGKIAVAHSNLRWCSDGFELACDNGEKVRVAFALDCCDREAMAWIATTQGIKGEDVRDLMVASVESRFGPINRLPRTIEWLSDNGPGYIARETRAFAHEIGLEPLTTPVTSPQSNGMAEAFVRTIKRDYARVNQMPDARTVIESLPLRFDHYNAVHPHSALRYQSPREFIAEHSNREAVSGLYGATTIGRNFTHQTISSVNGFFDHKKYNFNPFIASGSIGMCIDEFNGDNFDHGPPGFVEGVILARFKRALGQ